MQKEQRLSHPSWTFRLGRVFSAMRLAGENRGGDQFGVGEDVAYQRESRRRKRHGFQRDKISRRAGEILLRTQRILQRELVS